MLTNLYRNESLIQMETYETDTTRADALINDVRTKWALLREKGYAGDYPVEVLRSGGRNGDSSIKVVEIFKWRSQQAKVEAQRSEEYLDLAQRISSHAIKEGARESFSEAVRGFNTN